MWMWMWKWNLKLVSQQHDQQKQQQLARNESSGARNVVCIILWLFFAKRFSFLGKRNTKFLTKIDYSSGASGRLQFPPVQASKGPHLVALQPLKIVHKHTHTHKIINRHRKPSTRFDQSTTNALASSHHWSESNQIKSIQFNPIESQWLHQIK